MHNTLLLYIIGVAAMMPAGYSSAENVLPYNDLTTGDVRHVDTLDILNRIEERESRFVNMGGAVYSNPALRQFMYDNSYTAVSAGYGRTKLDKPVSAQEGTGCDGAYIDADSYVKYKKSMLWGAGRYETGHSRSPVWNEVADAELVYPYFTADAIGGDINNETYKFMGGYSSYSGRLAWGASLGYTAGHHYRAVDPRPRNVTGKLDVTAGMAYRGAGKYLVALGADFMKYKQTGDIDFMSELGQATVYHLTGLGTDYVRFRGNGLNTNYDGSGYGLQANIMPEDGNGVMATVHISRLTLETILTDMNKLPLNSLWHNSIETQIGYKHRNVTSWGVAADFNAYRRHGKENIFGDAASSVYPQIGTIEMYADNAYTLGVSALVEHPFGNVNLSYEPRVGYSHRCQIYADPSREWLINNWNMEHGLKASGKFGNRWHAAVELSWALSCHLSSHLDVAGAGDSESGLMDVLYSDFLFASSTRRHYAAGATATYALNNKNALRLYVGYARHSYGYGVGGSTLSINGAVVF